MTTKSEILRGTRKIALINVRVFDGQLIREPSTVIIDGELIGTDSDGAEIVDGNGGVLLPGFIDAHIHLENEDNLRQMSRFGITTGLDMATWPQSKLNNLRNRVGMTDIRSPGVPATSPGSLHSCLLPIPAEELVANPEDGKSYIAKRIAEGVDYIKVVCDVPGPDQATLNTLVTEAHKHKKILIAHASAYVPFAMAQDAGADVITHAPLDKVLDHEAASRMAAEKRIAVPTLAMMEGVVKPPSWSAILRILFSPSVLFTIIQARRQNPQYKNNKYENARDSVTAMYHAGVPILAGTDANSAAGSPFQVPYGESLHHELELLVEAGLSNVDALRAATRLPAKFFGLTDRGVIEVGKRADLVLISGDPIVDIRATRSIERVWCAGIEVES